MNCVGHLRTFQGQRSIRCVSLTPVTDHNALTHHILSVVLSREQRVNGIRRSPGQLARVLQAARDASMPTGFQPLPGPREPTFIELTVRCAHMSRAMPQVHQRRGYTLRHVVARGCTLWNMVVTFSLVPLPSRFAAPAPPASPALARSTLTRPAPPLRRSCAPWPGPKDTA